MDHESVARIVLVGEPTKMPTVRQRVRDELGIEVEDIARVDPMTAVAIGAAIYCESRDWSDTGSTAKATRRAVETGGSITVAYDYEARTASTRARVTIRPTSGASGATVQVDSPYGTTSARRPLTEQVVLDLNLPNIGANRFRAFVFDGAGRPVREASQDIVIERLLAATTGVPATQTIGVKLLDDQPGWQLLATNTRERLALLLDVDAPNAPAWWAAEIAVLQNVLACETTTDGARTICVCQVGCEPGPRTLGDLALRNPSIGPEELCCLLDSIESLRKRQPNAGWETALFIPEVGFLLATLEDPKEDRRAVITALLSGGVHNPALTPTRIREFNPCLTEVEIDQALGRLGLAPSACFCTLSVRPPEAFVLPGQPNLEKMFREHVIDVAHRPGDYANLGVRLPNGILLKGPTGKRPGLGRRGSRSSAVRSGKNAIGEICRASAVRNLG